MEKILSVAVVASFDACCDHRVYVVSESGKLLYQDVYVNDAGELQPLFEEEWEVAEFRLTDDVGE